MRRTHRRTEAGAERRPRRLLAVLVGVVVAAGVSLPSASSQEAGVATYAATISPTSVVAGTDRSFAVTLTNCPEFDLSCSTAVSVVPMRSATITFPQGFIVLDTVDEIEVAVLGPDGSSSTKRWTATSLSTDPIAGTTITLAEASLTDALLLGESVTASVSAVPKASGAQTITTTASAGLLEFSQIGNEPTVDVKGTDEEATVVVCSADSCTGSASHGGTTVTATATDGWQAGDILTIAVVDRDTEQCADYTADLNSLGGVVFLQRSSTDSEPSLSIEWKLAKHLVKANPSNGYGNYVTCYGGQNQESPTATFPTRADGTSSLGTDGQQWGVLPKCRSTATAFPCMSSSGRNTAGDAVVTTTSPWPWDPAVYGG